MPCNTIIIHDNDFKVNEENRESILIPIRVFSGYDQSAILCLLQKITTRQTPSFPVKYPGKTPVRVVQI